MIKNYQKSKFKTLSLQSSEFLKVSENENVIIFTKNIVKKAKKRPKTMFRP